MTVMITECRRCGTKLTQGKRKRLIIQRELSTGFGSVGFSLYLCDTCADKAMTALLRWTKGA